MINNIEILTVNYNTPDLIKELIKSVRDVEGDYPIRVIDGSDSEPYKTDIIEVCEGKSNVILEQQGWNIHHGRGLDLGITTSNSEWVLMVDSETCFKEPIIEKTFECAINNNKLIVGDCRYVDNRGMGGVWSPTIQYPFKYYHASYLLFKTDYYLKLKSLNAGFIHHGAIGINMTMYLYQNGLSDIVGASIWEYLNVTEKNNYFHIGGRGTVNRFGYNI